MLRGTPPLVAALNYLAPTTEPLRTYAYDPPDGGLRFNGRLQAHEVPIHDARELAVACTLDREGFMLCPHASRTTDFWNEPRLKTDHYPEVQALVRDLTGARRAIVFDHTLRRRAPGRPPLDGRGGSFAAVREPVGRVHADYTPRSGPERCRATLAAQATDTPASTGAFMILGLWRPLNDGPLLDAPLALADARSIDPADLVPNDLVYPDRRGQTYAVLHNPNHRWFHFPRQTRDELIVFKHYDSRCVAGAWTGAAAHTAFEDPGTPPDASPRCSIELRVLVPLDD